MTFRLPALSLAAACTMFAALSGCQKAETPAPAAAAPAKPAIAITDEARTAAAAIDAPFLSQHIRELSDDSFEGRGPATAGDRKARDWIVGELQALGLEPGAADGQWQQPFDIVGVTAKLPPKWNFSAGTGGRKLALSFHDQYVGAGGTQDARVSFANAEVVFVGYGIQAPEFQWDDYKGADLKGKVLLMLNNDPDWDPALFAGTTRLWYGRWDYKFLSAARQGAAAAIIVHTAPSAGYGFQVVQSSWAGEQFELPSEGEPHVKARTWVTEDAAKQLVALGGKDLAQLVESAKSRDFRPVPLGVRTSLSFTQQVKRAQTANVAGLLRGRDPQLAREVVVYSAHHDHLGIGPPDATGDRIYNGAIDNAAGVGQVLAIAKAFKALPTPPKRSVLFLLVAAEEQGLLGSAYYAQHPTFPPGRIAANINIDSANVTGRTTEVVFIGKGKSSLDEVVEAFAKTQDRTVVPDAHPDRGYFYRSDQFSLAKIGVPAFMYEKSAKLRGKSAEEGEAALADWDEKRYHQPSDEFDPGWNFDGMVEDAQLGFYTGLYVADEAQLPAWNAGDEFEATRKAAIAAAPAATP